MWVDRRGAMHRVRELAGRVNPSDLTDLELLAMIALLEPADERVNGQPALVLQLAAKQSRPRRPGNKQPRPAS